MRKLGLVTAAGALAAVMGISATAWAHSVATTVTLVFADNPVVAGTAVDITGTVAITNIVTCDIDHTGFCGDAGTAVTVGKLRIEQARDGEDNPTSCTNQVTFATLAEDDPTDGDITHNFDTTGLSGDIGFRTKFVTPGGGHKPVTNNGDCDDLEILVAGLEKEITSGPNVDGDGDIDVVVEVGQDVTTPYDFTITYLPGEEDGALIVDTVPAEWDVTKIDDDGTSLPVACGETVSFDVNALTGDDVDVIRGGKSGKNCRSANVIEWKPDPEEPSSTLKVDVTTRINPGHGKRDIQFFSPTSCGPLILNDGAIAFELPLTVPPVVLFGPTDPICLVAVDNPGTGTGDRSASADHDSDTLASFDEACTNAVRTDPCLIDTDGDGDNDNADNCPLISNGDQADGDSDGVGTVCDPDDADDQAPNDVVAECADGIDNDGDGAIDHSSSALSTKGGDDQCASAADNDESA